MKDTNSLVVFWAEIILAHLCYFFNHTFLFYFWMVMIVLGIILETINKEKQDE